MKSNANTDDFVGFYDFEIEKAERNLNIFLDRSNISEEDADNNKKNFVKFFNQHDERRGTDILSAFPELAVFLGKPTAKQKPVKVLPKVRSVFDLR
jgi:hypothetical protein